MTELRCRPGDLAVTVGATNAENLGLIVEVVAPADATRWPLAGAPGFLWWVQSAGWPITYVFRDGRIEHRFEGPIPDRCLQPIRGGADRAADADSAGNAPAAGAPPAAALTASPSTRKDNR
jgi:hypothetical protein